MKTRHPLAAMATVVVAVMLAACGEDDSDGDTGPSVTLATAPPTPSDAPPDTGATATAPQPESTVADSEPAAEPPTTAAPPTDAPASTAVLDSTIIAVEVVAEVASPVDLAWRIGDDTLFVVAQDGLVVPLRDGALGDPVLDVTDLTSESGEQGLLGLAFSPDGTTAYINHTDNDGDTVIAEYAVDATGAFDADSRREVLTIDQPYPNHNGGNVMFGPDGMLYIGMGDGGSGGDPERRALNVGDLLGKILRIDPRAAGDAPYTVPADNPFVGVSGARPEIWSVGVRNPWRMSFDRATGDLWFGDVGQNQWEEIDVAWADEGAGRGLNFGWSAFEGAHRFNDDQPAEGATPPIFEYAHENDSCSVSGGAVYRGAAIPSLVGWYVFSDYCASRIVALQVVDKVLRNDLPIAPASEVSAVREGPDGELYVLSLDGTVSRIVPA